MSLVVAGVADVSFLAIEGRVGDPMVPLGLFRSRVVSLCVTIGFVVNAAFHGVIFIFSLFFQQVLGLSAVAAGLMFLPMTALIAVANVSSAKVAGRFGPRVPIAVGQLVCALGLLGLFALLRAGATGGVGGAGTGTDRPLMAALLVPVGIGLGFAVPSLTAAMLGGVEAERAGLAGGVFNSARQTGGALSVAVFGALVSHRATFLGGMRMSLLIAAGLLFVTAGVAVALPRRQGH